MKNTLLPFVILLSTILSSCNDHELREENERLRLTIETLQDSIEGFQEWNDLRFLHDTLGIDTSLGIFGELYYSDTLTLHAEFADCGEWGGHREWLKIYSDKEFYKCLVIFDSVVCRFEDQGKKYFRTDSTVVILDQADQEAIMNYLLDLTRMTFRNQEMYSNATTIYTASITTPHDFGPLFNFEILCYDHSFNWDGFERLRREIKN